MAIQLDDGSLLLVPELSALSRPVPLGAASEKIEIDAIQVSDDQLVAAAGPDERTLRFWSRGSSAELHSASVQVSPGGADASMPVLGAVIDGSRTALADGLGGVPGPHVVFLQSVGDVTTLRAWRIGSTRIADLGRHPGAAGRIAGPVHVAGEDGERIVIADDNQRLRVIDPNAISEPVTLADVALRNAIAIPRADDRFFAELEPDSELSSVWAVTTTAIVEDRRTLALIDQDAPDPVKDSVKLWRDRSPMQTLTGVIIDADTLKLDDADDVTSSGRTITLRHRKFRVKSVTQGGRWQTRASGTVDRSRAGQRRYGQLPGDHAGPGRAGFDTEGTDIRAAGGAPPAGIKTVAGQHRRRRDGSRNCSD